MDEGRRGLLATRQCTTAPPCTAGSGRMLPIGLDLAGVERLLDELEIPYRSENGSAPPVEIACANAPASTVICGTEQALQPVVEELERRNLQPCPIPKTPVRLQTFLYHLLRATDIFAMPRRAVGVTFLRPPTGPRLTCYVKKDPDWADINELGQFTERRGERSGGSIRFYDGDTGDLVLCIDAYVSFNSNPRWNDRPHSKHAISLQRRRGAEFAGRAPHRALSGGCGPAAGTARSARWTSAPITH